MKSRKFILNLSAIVLVIIFGITGCTTNSFGNKNKEEHIQTASEIETENSLDETTPEKQDIEKDNSSNKLSGENLEKDNDGSFDLGSVPEYSGKAYININGGNPFFSDEDKKCTDAFEKYSELDSLGRCGGAYANICKELMPIEERGSIGQVKPSGWHTIKYNGLIDGNYLYNRCHLIGYQLAGENANELNLITGTRYLNVVSMLEFENIVADYVEETNNHVLYRVTPCFLKNNLVASGVQMEGWSVEDSGEGVCFNVYCYNIQPGIVIDYATGDSWISSDVDLGQAEEKGVDESDSENSATQDVREYILNKNTKKFHLPTCSSADDIAKNNKVIVTGTIEDIKDEGYIPCAKCLAEYK